MRRAWRTFQKEACSTVILLMYYADNRIAYVINSPDNDLWISPDPSVTSTDGFLIAKGSTFTASWIEGFDTEMPVYGITLNTQTTDTVTIIEEIQEKADDKSELD